ncbi:MAG TPA: hypothetical protein VLX68_13125 [Chitinivibrionales bacterium]|nr:hypothetical protein [Chitinivibrionales bacterium]
MNHVISEEEKPVRGCRFEDSFSLPENQRKYPDDPYAAEHEKEVLEKWHRKIQMEDIKRLVV